MLIGLVGVRDLVSVAALSEGHPMSHWPLLSLVTFLPLVGVVFILMARGEEAVVARNARFIALWTSLDRASPCRSLLWIEFDPSTAQFQFVERANWITLGGFSINYHMGIDGISLFFVLLSTLLTFALRSSPAGT